MTPAAARSISRKIYRRPLRSCKKKRIHLPDEFVDGGDGDGGCASSSSDSCHLSPQQIADLLLTQPPLVGVQASVVAADSEEDSTSRDREALDPSEPKDLARSKLACDAGITLDFMAEAANFLLRDLELLASGGGQGSEDQNGKQREEDVVVVFRAIVSFCAQTDGAPRMRSGTRFVTKVD
jgi:hypothetical protein